MSTTSEGSVYQALRGHLATLRLAAAAEALPGVLEDARSENLGHTAMLERLLGIEVDATEARRRASLERFASLPAPWRLSDFDFEAQPSVDRALINELATLRFPEDATNVDTTADLYMLLLIASAIAFLAWLSRAVDNVTALEGGRPVRSPRGAIGWWFVPLATRLARRRRRPPHPRRGNARSSGIPDGLPGAAGAATAGSRL